MGYAEIRWHAPKWAEFRSKATHSATILVKDIFVRLAWKSPNVGIGPIRIDENIR